MNVVALVMQTAPWLVLPLRVLVVVAMLTALACTVSRSRNVDPVRLAAELGFVLVTMLMVTPLTEDIYFTYLAIFLLALVASSITPRPVDPAPLVLAAGTIAVYLYFLLPMRTVLHYGVAFIGLVATVLLGGIAFWLWRQDVRADAVMARLNPPSLYGE